MEALTVNKYLAPLTLPLAAGTIPGPADGGAGFTGDRDDLAHQATAHPGLATADDGLSTSVLNQSHRWDNPVARVTITRSR